MTTMIQTNELTADVILETLQLCPKMTTDPFEEMLKRSGFTPESEVLMIVPLAWLETELEPWLRVRRKWLKLSPMAEQAYIMDVGKDRQELKTRFLEKFREECTAEEGRMQRGRD